MTEIEPATPRPAGPAALERALDKVLGGNEGGDISSDRFFELAWRAAEHAGCELLFEIPPVLFGKADGRAAAIRCRGECESPLLFIVMDMDEGALRLLRGDEAPERVIDFTLAYAGVLSQIRNDSRIIAPLLQ
ncbi:MAG: hypothetical protein KDJ48_06690 [Nitratireductor sp.]|nr:hypothetical protein [Nitratireductor sp.]MCB1456349.1 hypothetical protein [Nitratireductor sp.]MCB1458935.1 hypothetical protein [Nitratireductor sp.]